MDYKNKYYKYKIKYLNLVGGELTKKQKKVGTAVAIGTIGAATLLAAGLGIHHARAQSKNQDEVKAQAQAPDSETQIKNSKDFQNQPPLPEHSDVIPLSPLITDAPIITDEQLRQMEQENLDKAELEASRFTGAQDWPENNPKFIDLNDKH